MTLEEFRNASAERKQAKGRRPQPYNETQRAFAIEYAQAEMASGTKKSTILRALGISDGTLSKWMGLQPKNDAGFRRVVIKRNAAPVKGIQLVTPGGYRVEGLSLESAAELLRALG